MYRMITALSNGILGVGGVLAVGFGVAGLLGIYLGSHGDAVAMIDAGRTILASR